MANKLKLGLVGADAAGRGWGPVAHMPALCEIEQIELAPLCTSRPESAAAAGRRNNGNDLRRPHCRSALGDG